MIYETMLEHSSGINRMEAFYALKSVDDMDVASFNAERWFDDLNVSGYGPVFQLEIDERWLDDLDKAA